MKSINRTLYYYELNVDFDADFSPQDGDRYVGLFDQIAHVVRQRLKERYQVYGERIVMIQSLGYMRTEKIIHGKLRCIRKDILPELMNTKTDEAKGIEAAEDEGLVETTHFLIDYSKFKPILCIEHNQFGSKIGDLVSYIKTLGVNRKCLNDLGYLPIVLDELKGYKRRMGKLSQFEVKVHKNNIDTIKSIDSSIHSALQATVQHFESEYAVIKLKFDYKQQKEQSEIMETVNNLIDKLIANKKSAMLFNLLRVKAEDDEKNQLLEVFDLLTDKVRSDVKVERMERYRTVVTADIVNKMKAEILKKFNHYK